MSTKLYTGFELPVTSFPEICSLVNKVRVRFFSVVVDRIYERAARSLCWYYDSKIVNNEMWGTSTVDPESIKTNKDMPPCVLDSCYADPVAGPLLYVHDCIRHECLDDTSGWKYKICVTLFPVPDGRVVGLFFGGVGSDFDVWMECSGSKPYGYWNNTDPDEGCSDEEWLARQETWEGLLGAKGPPWDWIPSANGATFELLPEYYYWVPLFFDPDKMRSYFKSKDGRALSVAQNILINRRSDEFKSRGEKIQASDMVSALQDPCPDLVPKILPLIQDIEQTEAFKRIVEVSKRKEERR